MFNRYRQCILISVCLLVVPSITSASLFWPLQAGDIYDYTRADAGGKSWSTQFRIHEEMTLGTEVYFRITSSNYDNAGDIEEFYARSTENALYTWDGTGDSLAFQTGVPGTIWYDGDTLKKLVRTESVTVPYGGPYIAYVYEHSVDDNPKWYTYVVPGIGIVKEVDYWSWGDQKAPLIQELVQISSIPRWIKKRSGPNRRSSHSAVVHDEKIYVFGGENENGEALGDFLEYNTETDTWANLTTTHAPSARRSHTAVLHNDKMYVFGGRPDKEVNDLYEYDFNTSIWTKVDDNGDPAKPDPRQGHTAVVYNGKMYVLGGHNGPSDNTVYYKDLRAYDFAANTWLILHEAPCGFVLYHTAVVIDGKMYVLGGLDENETPRTEVWAFDFSTQNWIQKNDSPLSTVSTTAVVFNHKMHMLGPSFTIKSSQPVCISAGLFTYNPMVDSWHQESYPNVRFGYSAAIVGNRMFVYGGQDLENTYFKDLWEYRFANPYMASSQ